MRPDASRADASPPPPPRPAPIEAPVEAPDRPAGADDLAALARVVGLAAATGSAAARGSGNDGTSDNGNNPEASANSGGDDQSSVDGNAGSPSGRTTSTASPDGASITMSVSTIGGGTTSAAGAGMACHGLTVCTTAHTPARLTHPASVTIWTACKVPLIASAVREGSAAAAPTCIGTRGNAIAGCMVDIVQNSNSKPAKIMRGALARAPSGARLMIFRVSKTF